MRLLLALSALTLLAGPALTAGSGSNTVSGYEVSGVAYSLAGESIAGVSFRLSPANARTVRARLSPAEPWTTCTVAGDAASCAVDTPIADVSALQVLAAS
jgi:hypothetical protein